MGREQVGDIGRGRKIPDNGDAKVESSRVLWTGPLAYSRRWIAKRMMLLYTPFIYIIFIFIPS